MTMVSQTLNVPESEIDLLAQLHEDIYDLPIKKAAAQIGADPFEVRLQLLLHLPRFRQICPEIVFCEIEHVSGILRKRIRGYEKWLNPTFDPLESPYDTRFDEISEAEAKIIHQHFHYIGSARDNSLHFGLITQFTHRICALLSYSTFDLSHMYDQLPAEISPDEVIVLSRVYAFHWSPKNQISFMLGRAWRWFAENRLDVKMFITYVNPNLGFTGASYRASNWVYFGAEHGTRYAYLDGEYITDRELVRKHHTSNPQKLGSKLGEHFTVSQTPLKPLDLYVYFPNKDLRAKYMRGFHYHFERP